MKLVCLIRRKSAPRTHFFM